MTREKAYASSEIRRVTFPAWAPGPDGLMHRTWHLVLRDPPSERVETWRAAEPSLQVRVDVVAGGDGRRLDVVTTALAEPMSDEVFYWATYRVFVAIDHELDHVEEIQGSPRDSWFPFRKAENP
ncbi:MAG: hypothetical protein J0L92_18810 [Deltaproteobacteria bacterium]|nr:hypothetical protein [Deltaproteobacteria bacterium]